MPNLDRGTKSVRPLNATSKNIVCNVYLYFTHQREIYEWKLKGNEIYCCCSICNTLAFALDPWTVVPFRAVELATGVRKRNIFRIAKRQDNSLEGFIAPQNESVPNLAERRQARDVMRQFFEQKLHGVRYMAFATKNGYWYGHFNYTLESLGFVFRRWNDDILPVETCSLIAQRLRYLRNVHQARKRTTVFYMGVCWIYEKRRVELCPREHERHTVAVLFAASTAPTLMPSFHVAHLRNSNVHDILRSWVRDLLKGFPSSSFLVITKAPWMIRPAEKLPSEVTPRQELVSWLKQHSIPCSEDSSRYQLLQLVEAHRANYTKPELQCIVESAGHSILFLPSNVLELNPVSHVWESLQKELKTESTADIHAALSRLDRDRWQQFNLNIIDLEEQYHTADFVTLQALEHMQTNTNAYRDETLDLL